MKDFDAKRILQQPFFKGLNLPLGTDAEIIETFDVTGLNDSAAIEKKLADLHALDDKLKEYRQLVKENISALKDKIVEQATEGADVEADAATLRQLNAIDDAAEILNLQFGKYYVDGKKSFDTQYRKEFGQRLKAARQELGFSQANVAKKIGLTRNAYQFYELGQRDPSIPTIRHLAKIFKKDIKWFFGN